MKRSLQTRKFLNLNTIRLSVFESKRRQFPNGLGGEFGWRVGARVSLLRCRRCLLLVIAHRAFGYLCRRNRRRMTSNSPFRCWFSNLICFQRWVQSRMLKNGRWIKNVFEENIKVHARLKCDWSILRRDLVVYILFTPFKKYFLRLKVCIPLIY